MVGGSLSRNRCRATAEPIMPAPPVTKTVPSLKCIFLRLRINRQTGFFSANRSNCCSEMYFWRNALRAGDPQPLA